MDRRTDRKILYLLVRSQKLELSQSNAMSFFQVSHRGAWAQGVESSSTALSAHKQTAGMEVEQPALIWCPYGMPALINRGLLAYWATMSAPSTAPYIQKTRYN